MKITGKSFLPFVAGMVLFPAACGIVDSPKEKAVITVGSTDVTPIEFKRDVRRMTLDMELTGHEMQTLLEPLVEKLVDHYLILEYGRQEGIEVSDQDLEKIVREIQTDYSEKDFQEILLREVIHFDEWKEALKERLLLKKIVNKVLEAMEHVPFQEIRDYYDAHHQEEFRRPLAVRFRQIVTSTREEAEKALQRLNSGEDMDTLIHGYIASKGREYGGEVGWVFKGDLDESVEKVVFSMSLENISPVVETPYGFHIFQVLERRAEGVKSFPEAIPEIEAKLQQERQEAFVNQWVESLRDVIPVRVNWEMLKDLELG
ncbi:MAG: peptidyl-prolyl cis-trans isomerase [Desulfatiglandales bacterium]